MLYHFYEMSHAAINPMRQMAKWAHNFNSSPNNPLASNYLARYQSAQLEMFLDATRRYEKPAFNLPFVQVDGKDVAITEEVVATKPFCKVLHFKRDTKRNDPPVLIIAPMSGHYATLLRGTVKKMLEDHDVYITDWTDARDVPMSEGTFDLDDYVDYIREFLQHLHKTFNARAHVLAVCQPGVPAMVTASLMAEEKDPARPASMTLMGSPIDVSVNPKGPNELATSRPLSWFENNVVMTVPFPNRGMMRRVYPGFLQLQGFMSMNLDRHVNAHLQHFRHLIKGDGESAEAHREFYDEYMAVMDLSADFYIQTIDRVFQRKLLAIGEYDYRDRRINPSAIEDIALFTIEGERDDITGIGQTEAAQKLVTNLPDKYKKHLLQSKVGHYGIFNGSRWREQIYPQVTEFIKSHRS